MKKIVSYLFVFVMSLFLRHNVLALEEECTQAEQLRLRQIATATTINYTFANYEYNSGFNVSISGFTNDFYAKVPNTGIYFSNTEGLGVATVEGFMFGEQRVLNFYASDSSKCPGWFILSKNIIVPYYNVYSRLPICEGLENYYLCRKFVNIDFNTMSMNEFVKRVENYKKSLIEKPVEEQKPPKEETKTFWDSILSFIGAYYIYFLVTIIIGGIVAIIVIEVKKRRGIL